MINKTVFAIIMAILTLTSLTGYTQKTILPENEIPLEIQSYVTNNFSSIIFYEVIKDEEGDKLTYDITLNQDICLEFNWKMEIIKIESTVKLQDTIFPSKILMYVSYNYPNDFITSWETDFEFQQIKLTNNLKLLFSVSGDFQKIIN